MCWFWKQKNKVVCKDACINPLNHFPAPPSLLCYLGMSATRGQGGNEEGFLFSDGRQAEVTPAALIQTHQRRPRHANQKRICLKRIGRAARLMFAPSQPLVCRRSALALIKASAEPLQHGRIDVRVWRGMLAHPHPHPHPPLLGAHSREKTWRHLRSRTLPNLLSPSLFCWLLLGSEKDAFRKNFGNFRVKPPPKKNNYTRIRQKWHPVHVKFPSYKPFNCTPVDDNVVFYVSKRFQLLSVDQAGKAWHHRELEEACLDWRVLQMLDT